MTKIMAGLASLALILTACGERQEPPAAQQSRPKLPLNGSNVSSASVMPASEPWPQFVQDLVSNYKQAPPGSNPGSVWRYRYNERVVYFVPRLKCCDIPSELYTAGGELLCEPDGGLSGTGDGTCPDFFKERASEQLIWRDERAIPTLSEPVPVHP